MTVPPAGQSCSTCTNYLNSECHFASPNTGIGWTPVRADDWCSSWGLTTASSTSVSQRETIAIDTTWYVSPNGNDTNSGTASAPFKTIDRGLQKICDEIYFKDCQPSLQLANGTYNEPIVLRNYQGTPNYRSYPRIVGDIVTPANVVIKPSSGRNPLQANSLGPWIVAGVHLDNTNCSAGCVTVGAHCMVQLDDFELTMKPIAYPIYFVDYGGTLHTTSYNTSSGYVNVHGTTASAMWDLYGGMANDECMYAFIDIMNWTGAFINANYCWIALSGGGLGAGIYTGTVTGARLSILWWTEVYFSDGQNGAFALPGDSDGTLDQSCTYNGYKGGMSATPDASILPSNAWGLFKLPDTTVKLAYNDSGTIKLTTLTT